MICKKCGRKMKCTDTRPRPGNIRKRVYECHVCDFMLMTTERSDEQDRKKKSIISKHRYFYLLFRPIRFPVLINRYFLLMEIGIV
jgi:hypothetical protein